jgi:hypothetical protein
MKITPDAQELLDRYFYAIKNELGGKDKDDIVTELQSNLMDSLEESYPQDAELNKAAAREVLLNNGSPQQVAEKFHGPRYLIGPRIYPQYIEVLRIVLTVLGTVLVVSYIISSFIGGQTPQQLAVSIAGFIGSLWNAMLASAAVITFVFAVMERKRITGNEEIDMEKWKPEDLPEMTNPQNVRIVGHVFGILGGLIWISILIYLLNKGEIFAWINGEQVVAGTINSGLKTMLPYFIAVSGLELANHAVILVQQVYSTFSRWFKIILEVANTVLLAILLGKLPLVDFSTNTLPQSLQGQYQILDPMIHKSFAGFLIFLVCVSIIGIIKDLVTELTKPAAYRY